jgi:membrane protease YdiL (CAAX protease family)
VRFVVLLFALSVPFWIVGALRPIELLPALPVSALQAACPLLAALLLVHRENGGAGVAALLRRSADYRRISSKVWYLPALLVMPAVTILSYALMRALQRPLPDPRFPVGSVPGMALAFLLFAWTEEVGWSGYATDRMQRRWTALRVGLVLGVAWAAWHLIPLLQAGRDPAWIAW